MDQISLALFGMSAGAGLTGSIVVATRWSSSFAARAGAGLFLFLALVSIGNVAGLAIERLPAWAIQLQGALTAALFPLAWLYVRDLTSDRPRPLSRGDLWHFATPIAFIPHIIWAAFFLGARAEESLWTPIPMPPSAIAFAVAGLFLTGIWAIQLTVYTVKVALVLQRLPARLRRAFASVRGRDLVWLRTILVLFAAHLPLALAQNLGLVAVPDVVFAAITSLLACAAAGWGAQQLPVFQLSGETPNRIEVSDPEPGESEKYSKSLLDDERLERISVKLAAAFDQDNLHLDPNLSLARLAQRIGVTENHLSQTFTRRVGQSFFDYVNARRIEAAKELLLTTEASVTDISVETGFNARSAFYNAFKSITGTTPAAYRREARKAAGVQLEG